MIFVRRGGGAALPSGKSQCPRKHGWLPRPAACSSDDTSCDISPTVSMKGAAESSRTSITLACEHGHTRRKRSRKKGIRRCRPQRYQSWPLACVSQPHSQVVRLTPLRRNICALHLLRPICYMVARGPSVRQKDHSVAGSCLCGGTTGRCGVGRNSHMATSNASRHGIPTPRSVRARQNDCPASDESSACGSGQI
jgi:hypothetical protein